MIIPIGDEIKIEERWVFIPHNIIPYAYDNMYYISTWGRIFNISTQTILPKNIYYDLELNRYNACIAGIRTKSTFKDICLLYDY